MIRRFLAIIAVGSLIFASAVALAQPSDPPGNSGNAPGQQGDAPGNSGNAPGQQGDAPGNSGNAPGQQGDAPGNSGNAPGQQDGDTDSGEAAPDQTDDVGEAPGNSEAAHACQQGGYMELAPEEDPTTPFENTGDCVSYAAQGGELVELEAATDDDAVEEEIDNEDAPVVTEGTQVIDGPGNSDAAHACQQGGYMELAPEEDPTTPFENTGDCVSYAAQGGELVELGIGTPVASPEASPVAN